MKQRLTPIAIGMCLLGFMAVPAFAAVSGNSDVSARTQTLEQQVLELKREMAALKHSHTAHTVNKKISNHHGANAVSPDSISVTAVTPSAGEVRAANQLANADQSQNAISGPQYLPQSGLQYLPIDLDVPGQSFVSTGPYIGVPLQYNGGDLIVNNPSVNEDVSLLNLRKNISQRLRGMGLKETDQHSHLLLSGVVEGQANYKSTGGGKNNSDIDITNAGLDAYILGPSTWTTGLISIRYDNSIGAQEGSLSMNARTQNSRVVIDKAFIVLGDFTKSPVYGTIGQMYVPFGQFSSTMISNPITKLMFRTQDRAVLVGYQGQCANSFYGSAFAFKGDSRVGSVNRINNGGANLGYRFDTRYFSGNFGGGYIANIADSQGMQNNGLGAVYVPPAINVPASTPVFGGFGAIAGTGSETLVHRVAAYDVRGLFSIGKTVDVIAEFITAASQFSKADLTMNSHGARPKALNSEIAYTFQSLPKPTSISLGYGMSKDALALGMPQSRWSTTVNTSIWRNTLQSLEFRHDNNYAESAVSSGSDIVGPTASGRSDNMVTAQFDLYF
jgi:hypothetical protein